MADAPSPSAEEIFQRLAGCVVSVEVPEGSGAGLLLSRSGVVATNHHLVEGWSTARVGLRDGSQARALLLRSYRDVDLAFLQLQSPQLEQALALAQCPLIEDRIPSVRSARLGEPVLVIGHPLGLTYSLTEGVVSALDRQIEGRRYLQLDAAINPGNSGGPVCALDGELLGLVSCSRAASQGLHFAIPIALVLERLAACWQEQAAGGLRYCAACGALSSDPSHCSHCGALLALADALPELEAAEAAEAAAALLVQALGQASEPSAEPAVDQSSAQPLSQPSDLPADQPVACRVCGSLVPAGRRYCPHCGTER